MLDPVVPPSALAPSPHVVPDLVLTRCRAPPAAPPPPTLGQLCCPHVLPSRPPWEALSQPSQLVCPIQIWLLAPSCEKARVLFSVRVEGDGLRLTEAVTWLSASDITVHGQVAVSPYFPTAQRQTTVLDGAACCPPRPEDCPAQGPAAREGPSLGSLFPPDPGHCRIQKSHLRPPCDASRVSFLAAWLPNLEVSP